MSRCPSRRSTRPGRKNVVPGELLSLLAFRRLAWRSCAASIIATAWRGAQARDGSAAVGEDPPYSSGSLGPNQEQLTLFKRLLRTVLHESRRAASM